MKNMVCWLQMGLLLLLWLHLVLEKAEAGPFTARIAFFNYPWEADGVQFDDDEFTHVQEAMAPLAVALFNDRKDDIIPALGGLGACNKQLSIPYTCATAGSPRMAFAHTLELAQVGADYPHVM